MNSEQTPASRHAPLMSQSPVPLSDVQDILIYGVMGIGNLIMMTPALRALRAGLADARIVLLVDDRGSDAAVSGSDLADEILRLPADFRRNPEYIPWICRNVRGKFDTLLIPPHGTAISLLPLTLLSKAPHKVAITHHHTRRAPLPFVYSHRIEIPQLEHESASVARIVKYLGLPVPDLTPQFHITDANRQRAQQHLQQRGLDSRRPRIVVHVASSNTQTWKRWPSERFVQLCQRLQQEQDAEVLLVGSWAEREKIVAGFSEVVALEAIVAGELDLKASAALVEDADLVVANDSAISHIAAAMGTPVVVVFGPTDERVCGPMTRKGRIVTSGVSCRPCYFLRQTKRVRSCTNRVCLTNISVEQVHEACVKALAGDFDLQPQLKQIGCLSAAS